MSLTLVRPARVVLVASCAMLLSASAGARQIPSLSSADGAHQFSARGVVQLDYRRFLDEHHDAAPDSFALRRARIYLDGTLYGWLGFRVAPDFVEAKLSLLDAYLEARFSRAFVVRAGKFKSPFGLERLQVGADIRFAERAMPTVVAPNRDLGLAFTGDVARGRVNYTVAVMNGVTDGASAEVDTDRGKDLTGRVMVQAWPASAVARRGALSVGFAGSWGRAHGTVAQPGVPSFATAGLVESLFRFRTGATAEQAVVSGGARVRLSPQGTYYRGPVGVMGEYVRTSEAIARGAARATFHASAWQLAGTWMLTGEAASYKGVNPKRPIKPGSGGWGAFEVGLRGTGIAFDGSVFPLFADPAASVRRATALGVVANWYWNPTVKVVTDYEYLTHRGGAAAGDRRPSHTFTARMQFWF